MKQAVFVVLDEYADWEGAKENLSMFV